MKSDLVMIQALISMVPKGLLRSIDLAHHNSKSGIYDNYIFQHLFFMLIQLMFLIYSFISNKNNKNIGTTEKLHIILLTAIYNKIKSIFQTLRFFPKIRHW